ncbi:MAG: ABC transporter permease [Ponticaulis sp.]|nr:ABC transporter permease [Ponticaulis sp.]
MKPFQWVGAATLSILQEAGRLAAFAGRVKIAAITPPLYVMEILRQIIRIGYFSLPVVGLTAIFTGAALALNIYVGGSRFNAEQFVPNIVVLGITRELGPVLAALMLAGRVSAGIAAEIGTMKVTEQIDALHTLSTDPFRYLYAPRFWAAVLSLPILVFIADIIGVYGGYLVSTGTLDFSGSLYIRNTMNYVTSSDIAGGMIKAAIFGGIVALMGCYHGSNSRGGASGVGRAATLAVVSSAVLIFFSNFLLTTLFARIGL